MEKLTCLIKKEKKMIIYNRIGLILFFVGLLSLFITVGLTITTRHPFFACSIIPMIPIFISAGIYESTLEQITKEILLLFKDQLKKELNNDLIYVSTNSQIETTDTDKYNILVECKSSHMTVLTSVVPKIINELNENLPAKFKLTFIIKTKI